MPSLLTEPSSYANDAHHHWLSILLKVSAPVDANMLEGASLCTCFAVVDKESKLTDPWRRVIIRKVCKNLWEVLDEFGKSVLDNVTQHGEKGIVDRWGAWYRHPNLREYKHAILTDKCCKSATEDRELHLREYPKRKHLHNSAYDSMTQQGQAMKKKAQNKTKIASFDLGSIVQVPLHDVDTTKADGKNLTLVVVEVVTKDDTSCPMYHLACRAGVLDTLYHSSHMTTIESTSDILGLENVIEEWTGLPRIRERKAAALLSMVGDQGKHIGCRCKRGTCLTKR